MEFFIMDIESIVLSALENITGLPADELKENMSMDLKENDILDSVSCASLAVELEDNIGKKFKADAMEMEDFRTVEAIISAVNRIMA